MQTQTETKTTKKTPPVKKRKISVKRIKLSEQDVGFTFSGKYMGFSEGAPFTSIDQKSGEIVTKQLKSIIMENETGDRVSYLADAGLVGAIGDALVKEGNWIEVVKLEKEKLTKGRTMNAYDIFAIEAPELN